MSVKRYQPVAQCVEPSYQAQMIVPKVMEFSEGDYVLHSDYARLKAEVESVRQVAQDNKTETEVARIENARLKSDLEYVRKMRTEETLDLQEMSDWNNAMRARVKRLIEAGDMIVDGYLSGSVDGFNIGIMMWNDAKEDKQP